MVLQQFCSEMKYRLLKMGMDARKQVSKWVQNVEARSEKGYRKITYFGLKKGEGLEN